MTLAIFETGLKVGICRYVASSSPVNSPVLIHGAAASLRELELRTRGLVSRWRLNRTGTQEVAGVESDELHLMSRRWRLHLLAAEPVHQEWGRLFGATQRD